MKKIILVLITLTALALVGCGKIDPNPATADKTPAIADSSVTETTKSQTPTATSAQTQITVATTVTSVATSTTAVTVTTAKTTTATDTANSLESYRGVWCDSADTSEIAVYSVGNTVKFNMYVYHQYSVGGLAELIDGKYVFHTSTKFSGSDFKGILEFLSDGIKLTVTESDGIDAKVGDVFYFTQKDPYSADIDGWPD